MEEGVVGGGGGRFGVHVCERASTYVDMQEVMSQFGPEVGREPRAKTAAGREKKDQLMAANRKPVHGGHTNQMAKQKKKTKKKGLSCRCRLSARLLLVPSPGAWCCGFCSAGNHGASHCDWCILGGYRGRLDQSGAMPLLLCVGGTGGPCARM